MFNEFNARSIKDEWNVFRGLETNRVFIGVIVSTVLLQVFIVEVGGSFTSTTGLTIAHWGMSILLAAFTLPLGILMRLIPVPEQAKEFADFRANRINADGAVHKSKAGISIPGITRRTGGFSGLDDDD